MGKDENAFLGIDAAHEAADLSEAAFDAAVQRAKPAHVDRLRAMPADLTYALNDYLFDNDNMAKLAAALLSPGMQAVVFMSKLRALVLEDLDNAAEVAAIQEVERG